MRRRRIDILLVFCTPAKQAGDYAKSHPAGTRKGVELRAIAG